MKRHLDRREVDMEAPFLSITLVGDFLRPISGLTLCYHNSRSSLELRK